MKKKGISPIVIELAPAGRDFGQTSILEVVIFVAGVAFWIWHGDLMLLLPFLPPFLFGALGWIYYCAEFKNKRVWIAGEEVILRSIFLRTARYKREEVLWRLVLFNRGYYIHLYNAEGKRVMILGIDWIHIEEVFKLRHYGKISTKEKEMMHFLGVKYNF